MFWAMVLWLKGWGGRLGGLNEWVLLITVPVVGEDEEVNGQHEA
jgi:hypothetical protein